MTTLVRILVLVAAVLVVGAIGALAMLDMPAPVKHVEKVIPNDRFQH